VDKKLERLYLDSNTIDQLTSNRLARAMIRILLEALHSPEYLLSMKISGQYDLSFYRSLKNCRGVLKIPTDRVFYAL